MSLRECKQPIYPAPPLQSQYTDVASTQSQYIDHLVWRGRYFRLFKLIRTIRLLKLPRLLEANPVFRRLRSRLSHSFQLLLSGQCFLLYVCHLFACLYIYISDYEMSDTLASLPEAWGGLTLANATAAAAANATTVGAPSAMSLEGRLTDAYWLPPTSVFHLERRDEFGAVLIEWDMTGTYFYALLWVMCAISGVGAAMPHTKLETFFSVVLVLGGFLVTAYVIGTFTTALSQMSAAANYEQQKRDYIDQFLRRKQIPKALRRQVAQFYEFAGFDDMEEMLVALPISLRLQLDLVLNRDIILKVPFFRGCDTSCLIVMVPRIQREYVWWDKTVVSEDNHSSGLHMLVRGFCKVTRGGGLDALLTTNDFFGEESLLTEQPSPQTVVTITQCQFMVLDMENFEELLELYPQMKRALTKYTAIKEKAMRESVRPAGQAREVRDKERMLFRVRVEMQRTSHLMPLEARVRLRREMATFADAIKALKESLRRASNPRATDGVGVEQLVATFRSFRKRRSSFTNMVAAPHISPGVMLSTPRGNMSLFSSRGGTSTPRGGSSSRTPCRPPTSEEATADGHSGTPATDSVPPMRQSPDCETESCSSSMPGALPCRASCDADGGERTARDVMSRQSRSVSVGL